MRILGDRMTSRGAPLPPPGLLRLEPKDAVEELVAVALPFLYWHQVVPELLAWVFGDQLERVICYCTELQLWVGPVDPSWDVELPKQAMQFSLIKLSTGKCPPEGGGVEGHFLATLVKLQCRALQGYVDVHACLRR